MEKLEDKINAWLRDHLIPRLAIIFDEKCSSNKVEYKVTRPRGSFFLSSLFFVSIKFPERERRVLVKLPSQDPIVRTYQNYEQLFANEILFYERLAINESADYPKCYLAGTDPVFEEVMVLEDLSVYGFATCPEKVNVHLDYVIAGLKSIARFHGNTYAIKNKKPEKFQKIVKNIIPIRYDKNLTTKSFLESINVRLDRVTQRLRLSGYDSVFTEKIANLLEDCFTNVMMKCVKPAEPLATIVHGDCTINNILFQKQNGSLKSVLIDFALIMYTSPAIDISTFVYMCCSRDDVKNHHEMLLKVYHGTLVEYMKERDVWDPIKYSYKALLRDYKQRAIFGYVIGAYFLPMMTEYACNNDILQLPIEKIEEINIVGGGEVLSNMLVDMLIDMREAGLLDDWAT